MDGNDTLFRGGWHDRLLGELGSDTLDGGSGNDTLDGDGFTGSLSDTDTASYASATAGVVVSLRDLRIITEGM